jgi:flagellar biogenesis protein FliO
MGASFLAFGRTILVLALIIGLLLVLARFARKLQPGGAGRLATRSGARIDVLSRRSLGKHVSLVVVRAAHRTFLVGQSAQQMTLLAELDADDWVPNGPSAPVEDHVDEQLPAPGTALGTRRDSSGAWDAFIDHLREMTVRR